MANMSEKPAQSEPASPPPSAPAAGGKRPSAKAPKSTSRRGGVLAPIALILALLALAAVAYGGWQWWHGRQSRQADARTVAQLRQQVATLTTTVHKDAARRQQAQQVQQSMQAANQALDQRLNGMSERVDSLENAVAGLARHNQQGHRAMLLDQTAMLLRMGQERYALFHDAAGALKAYTLAAHTLAAVDDPAFAGVRRTLDAEHKALAASHPSARAEDLATLAHLRSVIPQLPLQPLNADKGKAPQGFWQRVWRALSTAVVVRRVNDSPQNLADARLTRQLAALDVAQAEAARLAWNQQTFRAALKRVARSLATAFNTQDADVRKAQATVKQLLAEPAGKAPTDLGKALKQLRNVRAVRGVQSSDTAPATPASTPQPATSTTPAAAESAA